MADARNLIDYFHALGITDVYVSPILEAAPGSTHGYDTCRPGKIADCLGGVSAWEGFAAALRERGMGLLLDVVPNHMGACRSNSWWWDVLKHGPHSRFAGYFDIDWHSRDETLRGKVLLPILGQPLREVIEAGELQLAREDGEWVIRYHDHRFPIAPGTPAALLRSASAESPHELRRDALLMLHDAQHYRLASWRVAPHEINYRRFFDVSSLVALRMEDSEVFAATHETVFRLLGNAQATGLRVDHPDGLREPREYFVRLQQKFAEVRGPDNPLYVVAEKILSGPEQMPADWPVAGTTGYDFLIQINALFVAGENERVMSEAYRAFASVNDDFHAVAYECKKRILELSFVADVNWLAFRAHELATSSATGDGLTPGDLRASLVELIACFPVYRTYVTASARHLSPADAAVLARAVQMAKNKSPRLGESIDFVASVLALQAELPAARQAEAREFVLRFQQLTGPAAAKGIEDTAFYQYHRLISLNEVGGEPSRFGINVGEFHQQNGLRADHWPFSLLTTATHDTKRGEDARARINVLSETPAEWRQAVFRWRKLNERYKTAVDGKPSPDGNDEYLFYQTLIGAWPMELLNTQSPAAPKPDSHIAGLEAFRDRVTDFMAKAIKEAKRHASWTEPNEAYENAVRTFVARVLDEGNSDFLADFTAFEGVVSFFGGCNSLGQTLVKLCSPGVPDIYQGSELWNLSLVDPDNRRPVDYDLRRRVLASLNAGHPLQPDPTFVLNDFASGAAKMFLISRALEFRREHRALFEAARYVPIPALGRYSNHVCAFARSSDTRQLIAVCPRLIATLMRGQPALPTGSKAWGTDVLNLADVSARSFQNVFTGQRLRVQEDRTLAMAGILQSFPVALLVGDPEPFQSRAR